jgi:glutamate dehydrogenase/leucine dehydrogenase
MTNMARKTIDVRLVVERANFALANPNIDQMEKRGVVNMIETILHETGNYKGFRYLNMYKEGDGYKWPHENDREYFYSKHLKEIK